MIIIRIELSSSGTKHKNTYLIELSSGVNMIVSGKHQAIVPDT